MELELEHILGGMSAAAFVEAHWGRRPAAGRQGATRYAALVDEAALAALLEDAACDVVLVRDGRHLDEERPRDLAAARRALGLGATVAFRHVEQNDAALGALGRRLSAELHGSPNVHVYWSPPGRGSFGWHCDPEDVFLLQIRGSKRYRWRENGIHPWPLPATMAATGGAHLEEGPIDSCTLEAGGWLYLPAGWWHETEAVEASLAVSVGLLAPAPLDVLEFLASELARDPAWRRRLPPVGHAAPGSDEEKAAAWRAALEHLAPAVAARLADPELPLRFLRASILRSMRGGRL